MESTVPKKTNVSKIILATTLATSTFYIGSAFVSYHNKTYREFFVGKVPLGRTVIEYGEAHDWDDLTVEDVATASTEAFVEAYAFVSSLLRGKAKSSDVVESAKVVTEKKVEDEPTVQAAKTQARKLTASTTKAVEQEIKKVEEKAKGAVEKEESNLKKVAHTAQYEIEELVGRAEAAIAGKRYTPPAKSDTGSNVDRGTIVENIISTADSTSTSKDIYDRPLPLGFEPPPGYILAPRSRPKGGEKSNSSERQKEPVPLPLIAPVVADVSEPIITHLANTIDNLASYLKSDPNAAGEASGILESAKSDLSALVDRIDVVKEQERNILADKLDEQTREYTLKLLELEMEAQDKLDEQEAGFRRAFELEKARIIQAYREKLDHELKTQTELINER